MGQRGRVRDCHVIRRTAISVAYVLVKFTDRTAPDGLRMWEATLGAEEARGVPVRSP